MSPRNISTEGVTDPFLAALNDRQLRSRLRECLRWLALSKWDVDALWTQQRANMHAYWEVQNRWVEAELDRREVAKRRAI